ncbi:MAG: hypothetical protein IPK80_31000 [Nannocystis sp.]|nr:hypothetical protein [Nannocystis sp.]
MNVSPRPSLVASVSVLALIFAGCGDDGASTSATSSGESSTGSMATTAEGSGSTGTTGTTGTTGSTGTESTGATTSATEPGTTTASETTGGEEGFRIGVDVTDISPDRAFIATKDLYMGAYGAPMSRGPAQGVHDPIFARSFAFEAGGVGLLMSVVDLPGMGNQNTREVRKRVAAMTGLSEAQVLIGSTHSHSSPDLMGLWGGVPKDYREWLLAETSASMASAWESRQSAELRVGTGTAPANNRRGWGYTDDAMIVLDAFDLQGGRIGTLVNFAAHPVILGEENKLISCDYTGYVIEALEDELGAPVALFNGTLGDATPKTPPGDYADDFDRAAAYGAALAEIAAEITTSTELVAPYVGFSERKWVQKVENQLFLLAAQVGILQYDFEGEGLLEKTVTTQATYFRLGVQVQGVGFPGESLTRNGMAIKEAMKAPHRMVLGNTGDALGYFIPSDEWQTGKNDNYEEGVSLGKSAGDRARDFIKELIAADNEGF